MCSIELKKSIINSINWDTIDNTQQVCKIVAEHLGCTAKSVSSMVQREKAKGKFSSDLSHNLSWVMATYKSHDSTPSTDKDEEDDFIDISKLDVYEEEDEDLEDNVEEIQSSTSVKAHNVISLDNIVDLMEKRNIPVSPVAKGKLATIIDKYSMIDIMESLFTELARDVKIDLSLIIVNAMEVALNHSIISEDNKVLVDNMTYILSHHVKVTYSKRDRTGGKVSDNVIKLDIANGSPYVIREITRNGEKRHKLYLYNKEKSLVFICMETKNINEFVVVTVLSVKSTSDIDDIVNRDIKNNK